MPIARGVRARIVVQKETAFGSDPATPAAKLVYFTTESITAKRDNIIDPVIRGTRDAVQPIPGAYDVSGTLNVNLEANGVSRLLGYALGSVTTAGSGPYTHTIKVGSSVPSFLLEKGFTDIDQYIKFNGCKINSFSIDFVANDRPQISFDIIGANVTVSTSPFHSTPTDEGYAAFSPYHITSLLEGGNVLSNAVRINRFSVSNDLDADYYYLGGGGKRGEIPEGIVKVSGSLQAVFENASLLNKALNASESSLKIVYSKGTGNGSAGNEYIEFFVPKLMYSLSSPVIDGPRGLYVELEFTGYYTNQTEGTSLQIVVKNSLASINN